MATFDEMLVRLLFDTSDLEKGAKQATATVEKTATDLVASAEKGEKAQTGALAAIVQGWNAMVVANRKAAEASTRASKEMVSGTEKLAQSGERAIRTFGALFLMFAGARSIKDFTSSMISLDAAVGRVAHNTGSTTEVISGIGRAAERIGGTFDGAVSGVRGFVDAYQQLRLTGQSGILDPIARLQGLTGRSIRLTDDWRKSLGDVADALQALDQKNPAEADYLGRQITGDEGLTTLLKKGRRGLDATVFDNPITQQQAEQAQKLQAQLVAVRQSFQDIGNSILMDFGPAMLKGIGWVKDLIEQNRGLIETKVEEWIAEVGQWFTAHKADIEGFGKAIGDLAGAAASLATAFAAQSPATQAMELFAATMSGTVLRAVTGLSGALSALFALPAPAWFLALNPAVLGTAAVGAVLAAGDPNKSVLDGGHPVTAPQDNDTGLPGVDTRPSDTSDAKGKMSGAWTWFTDTMKKLGFGDRLHDDPKTKDDISDTAKSTKGILDLMKSAASSALSAFTGVTASSGGVGGSGQHFGGGSSPGASLGDRAGGMNGRTTVAKGLTPEARAFLDDIASGEAPDYNVMNGGGRFSSYAQHPQPYKGGRAAGRYQFLGSTWLGIQRETGLKDFSPENQDKGAWYLAQRDYRLHTGRDLQKDLASGDPARIAQIGRDLHSTWVSTNGSFAAKYQRFYARDTAHPSASPVTAAATSPTAMAPSPAGTSEKAIGDAAAFAAEQRLRAGGNDPKDRALLKQYHQQQNAPTTAPAAHSPAVPTVGSTLHRALHAIAHANALLHHHGAVLVDITERGADRIARPLNEALRHRAVGAGRGHFNHDVERAARQAAAYRGLHRMAMAAAYSSHVTHNVDRSTETTVNGGIHVHTRATDARAIAADIEPHLHRGQAAGRADYGLA